jgi:hypothetical protein
MRSGYHSICFVLGGIALVMLLMFSIYSKPLVSAHQKQLYTIGKNQYLFVAGFLNEPVYVDDKSGVDFYAYTPDPKDPMSEDSNLTKPIENLQDSLKVEVSAGPNTKILDLEPDEDQPGHYTASFIPDVETTYNFRFFGNLSGSPLSFEYSCSPGAVSEDVMISNTTQKISNNVTRNGIIGGYECPSPRSDGEFPEILMSNIDVNNKVMDLEKKISELENATKTK